MAPGNVLSRNLSKLLRSRLLVVDQTMKQSVWTSENTVRSPFQDLDLPNKTLTEYVWENIGKWADKTALVCGVTNRSISYNELYKYSRNFGAQLRNKFKIRDGDVVCIMMGNYPEYGPAVLGALEAGAEVTTVNPVYTSHEVYRQLILSEPKVLIGVQESIPVLKEALKLAKKDLPIIMCNTKNSCLQGTISFQELIEDNHVNHDVLKEVKKKPDDVILLPYSSGTTGLPKGVELTNNNIVANCRQQDVEDYRHYDETTGSHQESVVGVLPFYHIYGLSIVMMHKLTVGAKVVTLPKFQPDTFLSTLKNHRVSLLCAAPPLVLFLGSHPDVKSEHLSTITRLTCGAAPLPKPDIDKILQRAVNTKILQVYGLTETSPLVSTSTPDNKKYTSAGWAVSNTELKIVDSELKNLGPNEVGELLIRGPQVMKGYRNNLEATTNAMTNDGWFRSGDLASIDESGMLIITDRLKELIKVKGYQVAPAELESVIKEHSSVLDAGVIGIPDKRAGELPKAFVVLKDGHKVDAKEIYDFVSERVAEYKKLKDIMFLDSLPKNSSGKLLRRVLKEKFC